MLLRGAEREEEPLATTSKRTTTGTDVVQHLHQRPAHTHRHSQLHLRRRLVHRVAGKRLQSLPAVSEEDWLCWRVLNRLRTGVGRAKTVMRRWAHLLSCRLLEEACTADDLAPVTERAQACARKWDNIV